MAIKFTHICPACNGEGKRYINLVPGGSLVEENPCSKCGGDGREESPDSMDDTLLNDILDKVNDCLDKCNDIFEKVNE